LLVDADEVYPNQARDCCQTGGKESSRSAPRMAAPKAVQVADRWHLLQNLSDALQQVLQPKYALLMQAARAVSSQTTDTETFPAKSKDNAAKATRVQQISEVIRSCRLARYEAVMDLLDQGISQAEISRSLGIGRRTIRRWSHSGAFPERKTRKRSIAWIGMRPIWTDAGKKAVIMPRNSGVNFRCRAFA
jgi:predicted DNA-binding transcriptional regulator AlpA